MSSKVRIKKKPRKSIVLTPRKVETVTSGEEEDASKKREHLQEVAGESVGAHDHKDGTLKVDEEALRETDPPPALDASDSTVVELNSSTSEHAVEQIPLKPEETDPPPTPETPGEEKFKFFCYRCGQRLKVPVAWANKSLPCGRCGHDLVIPPPLAGQEVE